MNNEINKHYRIENYLHNYIGIRFFNLFNLNDCQNDKKGHNTKIVMRYVVGAVSLHQQFYLTGVFVKKYANRKTPNDIKQKYVVLKLKLRKNFFYEIQNRNGE